MTSWAWLALVGGAVGLDSTAVGQIMISRPLVAGCLTGLVLGHPGEGVVIGAALEVFALVILPIGAARYPEAGIGAVAAAGAYLHSAPEGLAPGYLLLAVVFGLLWEWVGTASVNAIRRANESLVASPEQITSAAILARRHWLAIALDFARAVAVSMLGIVAGTFVLRTLAPHWSVAPGSSLAVLGIAGAAVLGSILPLFGGWSQQKIAFTLGLVCGSLLLFLR